MSQTSYHGITVIYVSLRKVCPQTHLTSDICSHQTDITSKSGTLESVIRVSQGQLHEAQVFLNVHM